MIDNHQFQSRILPFSMNAYAQPAPGPARPPAVLTHPGPPSDIRQERQGAPTTGEGEEEINNVPTLTR
jgi:hypothetical protein